MLSPTQPPGLALLQLVQKQVITYESHGRLMGAVSRSITGFKHSGGQHTSRFQRLRAKQAAWGKINEAFTEQGEWTGNPKFAGKWGTLFADCTRRSWLCKPWQLAKKLLVGENANPPLPSPWPQLC